MDLYLRVIDNHGNDLETAIALKRQGCPFEIIEVPWCLVALIKNRDYEDHLYVSGTYENVIQKFFRTIMNNGPFVPKEIISNSNGIQAET